MPRDRVGIRLIASTELDGDGAPIDPRDFGLIHRGGWFPLEALLDGVDTEWLELSVDTGVGFREAKTICVVVNTEDGCTLFCVTVDDPHSPPTEPDPDGGG